MTPQQQLNLDTLLLTMWAEPECLDMNDGYWRIAEYYDLSLKAAKRAVHAAIRRTGGNPHTSQGAIRAWKIWRTKAAGTSDLQ